MAPIIRKLVNSSEIEKLISFYPNVFKKTPLTFFTKRIENDPYLIPGDIQIAEENGEIVSSITVLRRMMYWKNMTIPFAGIGNVSTLPDKRGLGLASDVMRSTLKYIEDLPAKVTILFTGINPFYERFNFFTIPAKHLKFQISSEPQFKYFIRKFSISDISMVSNIYDTFNKNLCGPISRDLDYWMVNLKCAEDNEIFLVAELNGQIDGYIRIVPGMGRNEIWEFGYSKIEAFNSLIFEAAKMLNKSELKTAALCPEDLVSDNAVIKVLNEPSSLAMVYIKDNNFFNNQKEEFNNYCFWWTDNF